MKYSYGWEKLHVAVYGAATNTWSLQSRLENAYMSGVYLIREEDVPAEIWPVVSKWCEDLTNCEAVADEGTLRATVQRLSEDEARVKLQELVSMYDTVAQAFGSANNNY